MISEEKRQRRASRRLQISQKSQRNNNIFFCWVTNIPMKILVTSAIKFLVTFAIVANSFRIVQAVSIKHVFYNIETKICYLMISEEKRQRRASRRLQISQKSQRNNNIFCFYLRTE